MYSMVAEVLPFTVTLSMVRMPLLLGIVWPVSAPKAKVWPLMVMVLMPSVAVTEIWPEVDALFPPEPFGSADSHTLPASGPIPGLMVIDAVGGAASA